MVRTTGRQGSVGDGVPGGSHSTDAVGAASSIAVAVAVAIAIAIAIAIDVILEGREDRDHFPFFWRGCGIPGHCGFLGADEEGDPQEAEQHRRAYRHGPALKALLGMKMRVTGHGLTHDTGLHRTSDWLGYIRVGFCRVPCVLNYRAFNVVRPLTGQRVWSVIVVLTGVCRRR